MRILAISGSLRGHSTNTNLLRALLLLAPPELKITVYEEIRQLPAFNPDLESHHQIPAVVHFQRALQHSDAVLISTPEYAHGIPGSLKNALDWVVGSGEFSQKPVVLVNASSRATYAQAALKEVLFAMNANVLHNLEVTVDLPRRDMSPQDMAADSALAAALEPLLVGVQTLWLSQSASEPPRP